MKSVKRAACVLLMAVGVTAAGHLTSALPAARADPNCTEDCGVDKGQYELPTLYMQGGLQLPIDVRHAIITSHAICNRLNQGATRDQVRPIAGDGSPQQQDVVINAAIKVYCPGVKA